MTEGRGDR